jgi:hypothetical protein
MAAGPPVEAAVLGYRFDHYDLRSSFTWQCLSRATADEVRGVMNSILASDLKLINGLTLRRLFNPSPDLVALVRSKGYGLQGNSQLYVPAGYFAVVPPAAPSPPPMSSASASTGTPPSKGCARFRARTGRLTRLSGPTISARRAWGFASAAERRSARSPRRARTPRRRRWRFPRSGCDPMNPGCSAILPVGPTVLPVACSSFSRRCPPGRPRATSHENALIRRASRRSLTEAFASRAPVPLMAP